MEIITALQDILDNLAILPDVKYIKLKRSEDTCLVFTANQKAGFVFAGKLNDGIDGLTEVVGLTNIPMLRAILNSPGFKTSSATAMFVKATSLSSSYFHFKNNSGHDHKYPCVSEDMIDKLMPLPGWTEQTFDVTFKADGAAIGLFKYWQKKIADHKGGKHVAIFTKKGEVVCQYEYGKNDITSFSFGTKITGNTKRVRRYVAEEIASILNLYHVSKEFIIQLTSLGAMRFFVNSGVAKYNLFLLPLWEDWLEYESHRHVPSDLPLAIQNGFGRGMDVKAFIEKEIEDPDHST